LAASQRLVSEIRNTISRGFMLIGTTSSAELALPHAGGAPDAANILTG